MAMARSGGAKSTANRWPRPTAEEILKDLLGHGSMLAADIRQACEAIGVGWRTTQRASLSIGVVRHKRGMRGGWWWSLRVGAEGATRSGASEEEGAGGSTLATVPVKICLAAYGYEVPDDGLMHGVPQPE